MLLPSLLLSVAINFAVFLYAYRHQTDHYTDLTYGLTFFFITWLTFIWQADFNLVKTITTLMISLWSIRIAHYLSQRIQAMNQDQRFNDMRKKFWPFFGFWSLQAITIWIVLIPSIIILNKNIDQFSVISLLGIAIWLKGLIIETIADRQKFAFKMEAKNKEKFISHGLWALSRHPNYWGEVLCWSGIFIFAMPYLQSWEWLSIISPIWITFLLVKVSGIPLLEKSADKRYGDQSAYQTYKKNTPVLVPNISSIFSVFK